MPTTTADSAIPARIAAPTRPTRRSLAPEAASDVPRITAPNPYRNARTAWIPRIRRRSRSMLACSTPPTSERDREERPEPQRAGGEAEPQPHDRGGEGARPERRAG